jgi:hypothetical protein
MLGSDRYEDTPSYKGTVEGGTIRFTMVTESRASEHTPGSFHRHQSQGQVSRQFQTHNFVRLIRSAHLDTDSAASR